MRKIGAVILVGMTMVVVCGSMVPAQELGQGATPESFAPALSGMFPKSFSPHWSIESVLASEGGWARGDPAAELEKLDLSLQLGDRVQLSRAFQSSVAQVKDAPLSTGLIQDVTDLLSLALTTRTNITMSRNVKTTEDLTQRLLGGEETRRLGLTQTFGAGESAGTLSFERSWIRSLQGDTLDRTNTQTLSLASGLGNGFDIRSQLVETWDGEQFGENSRSYEAILGLPLSGGRAALAFTRSEAQKGLEHSGSRGWKLSAPFAVFGGTASFAHGRQVSYTDDDRVWERLTSLSSPLPGGVSFSGNLKQVESLAPGGLDLRDSAWSVDFPAFFGETGHFDTRRMRQTKTGLDQWLAADNFTLPLGFVGGQGIIEYRLNDEIKNGEIVRARFAQISTPLPFAGHQATTSYQIREDITAKEGRLWERLFQVFVPVKMFGDTTRLDYRASTDVNEKKNEWTRRRLLSLVMPLTSWHEGAQFSQSYERLSSGGPMGTVLTSVLGTPWKAFGTVGTARQEYVTVEYDESFQSRFVTDLSAQVNHEKLSLQREMVRTWRDENCDQRQMLALTTPKFDLFTPKATWSGQRVEITDTAGTDVVRTTIDLNARPLQQLTLTARLTRNDEDPGADTRTQQLISELAFSERLSLQGRFDATESSDQTVGTTMREIKFIADKSSPSGIALKLAYANWGAPGEEGIVARDVGVSVGDAGRGLGLTAQMTEYDPSKLEPYQDPLVRVSLSHQPASGMSLRLAYEDQEGRLAPEQAVAMEVPALGGSLRLAYAQNPLDRQGKSVLLADRYDAVLERQVMGSIDLKLEYRLYDYEQAILPETAVNYWRVQLAGGTETKGGKITLGYTEGDFVPQPDPKKSPPGSVLDLSFSRRWADNGRIILTLQRNTPPEDREDLEESVEGRLEYTTVF